MNLSKEDIKKLADSVTAEEIKAMFDMFIKKTPEKTRY